MSTMIIFTMYFVLQGKDLTIKVILMIALGKYFNVHQPPKKIKIRFWNKLMDKKKALI